ncbi:P-loop containing nucleoside triphosphate hydrolase [Pseudocohnilembus persalinus]|uniref:p-loop containing nucleoside triphosphate hydrolase n=1 Tax=Pseudocohnilembus persalinus TaxID=266149 RepID=A0A0V0QBX4_PSEPJ|nr:P-loop containing nucleoside triphosphate hydrolase [Pseudocohnilembus persalinus]|eukprot:KRW99696.1 P-loop containing nucleoside triphosphate hydrolase [Pseudocohnilembus persalinus]
MSNLNHIQNLIAQAKYLSEHNQADSDKYFQIYEELSNNQNGIIQYEDPKTREVVQESLTDKQIFQIRQQVMAYKYLIRNQPIPKDLEKNLYNINKDQWDIESDRIMQKSLKFYNEKIEKNAQLKQLIKERRNRHDQQMDQLDQTSKYFVDSKQFFIEQRKIEIQKLLQQQEQISPQMVKKLQCELKLLQLSDVHNQIFQKFSQKLNQKQNQNTNHIHNQLLSRNFYKKDKPYKRHTELNVEKFELNVKLEQNERKKAKHFQFLKDLQQHAYDFYEYHKKIKKKLKNRAKNVRQILEIKEKKRLEQADREMKERVQALKDKDWDAYTKLIQNAKNSRITELLKKTDDYLRDLGAKVLEQKGEIKEKEEDELDPQEMLAKNGQNQEYSINEWKNVNSQYYELTHSVKETVIEQPSILVGGKLKNYQLIGLQWMVSLYNNKLNGILADEMGLGKTIQTISLITYLVEAKKNPGPFLIVIPLSTMSNWVLEFEKWAPSIQVISYKGSPQVRKELSKVLKQTKWHVCITTYDFILKDKQLLTKFGWKYIIVDEGHRMKNARSKFAMVLGQQYQSEYRILLTGTPLQNNLQELWALLNFLLPRVFQSCEDFEKWFSIPVSKVTNDKDDTALTEEEQLLIITRLHQVLRPFLLRRVKKEVEKELPEKIEYVVKVELSIWQKLQERQIQQRQQNVLDPVTGKVQNKALMNLMMQLKKIANHPYLFMDSDQYEVNDLIWKVSGKFELLDRIIPKLLKFNHRILIFTQMTKVMDVLDQYFTFRGWRFLRLDGSTKEDERADRMKAFNAKDTQYEIFILSTRAGGLGLNLQTADTVIIFDSDWNPQQDLQAQDRAHRIGQKNEVRVLRFVTNTWIEKEILSKSQQKKHLDDVFIQTAMYNTKATEEDRQKKIEEMLGKSKLYEEVDDDIPADENINEMIARGPEELEAFNQMDQERYDKEKEIYQDFIDPRTLKNEKNKQEEEDENENENEIEEDENENENENENEDDDEDDETEQVKPSAKKSSNKESSKETNNAISKEVKKLANNGKKPYKGQEQQQEIVYKTNNYRLCKLEDVPEYIREPPKSKDEDISTYGRGHRSRKQVEYNDDVSELKFLKSIAINSDQESEEYKRKRRLRGNLNGEKDDENELDDEEELIMRDEQIARHLEEDSQIHKNNQNNLDQKENNIIEEESVKNSQTNNEIQAKNQLNHENSYQNQQINNNNNNNNDEQLNNNNSSKSIPKGRGRGRPARGRPGRQKKQVEDSDEDFKIGGSGKKKSKKVYQQYEDEEEQNYQQEDSESSFTEKKTRKSNNTRKNGRSLRGRAQNLDNMNSTSKKFKRLNQYRGDKIESKSNIAEDGQMQSQNENTDNQIQNEI